MDKILKKNEVYTALIEDYSFDGAGIAKINGCVVFVKNAIAGETCEIKILKAKSNMAYGKIEKITETSPERTEPLCPVFGKCGGCDFMHMTYEEELRFKLARVRGCLERIGGISAPVEEIIGADSALGYRNKVIYAVGREAGQVVTGFYRQRSHDVIPGESCPIQTDFSARAAAGVKAWMEKYNIPVYDRHRGADGVRHIFCRIGFASGQGQVTLVSSRSGLPHMEELVEILREKCPELRGIIMNINKTTGNTVLAGEFFTVWGEEYIEDRLCGLDFRLSPRSFYQINPAQTERLYMKAVEYAGLSGGETVLDLYCGIGTITLCMAGRAGRVIGAEIVERAIENAKENAERNGIKNAEFICADAGEAAARLRREGLRPDVVTVDPPRRGLAPEVIESIVGMEPRRVVYVSCDPATLARDLKLFSEKGYITERAAAVDMFPRTRHVETVALLSRKSGKNRF